MNMNENKNANIEMDDWNIKSHLNTSLDLSGISVSEDLIHRTLEAIKHQSDISVEEDIIGQHINNKIKHINRYIRGMAGVAVAIFIVLVGYNVLRVINVGYEKSNGFTNSASDSAGEKSDGNYKMNQNNAMDITGDADYSGQAGIVEDNSLKADKAETGKMDLEEKLTTDATADSQNGFTAKGESEVAKDKGTAEVEEEDQLFLTSSNVALTFEEISNIAPEQVSSINLTNQLYGTTVSLTNQLEILDFYSTMENNSYKNDELVQEEEEKIEDQSNYTIEINMEEPNEEKCEIIIGNFIMIRYIADDNEDIESYIVKDYKLLQNDLDTFIQRYMQ